MPDRASLAADGVDLDALGAWMDQRCLPPGRIELVERLAGGTQNVLVRFTRGGEEYVLRRPPLHKRGNSDETMRREARVLAALHDTDVPHPGLIADCADEAVIGAAFYLMAPVDGANPSEELPPRYLADGSWRRQLGFAIVDGITAIGAVDYMEAGLENLGRTERYLERQVARWASQLESYSALAGYPGPRDISGLRQVANWLEANRPSSFQPGLMHGDYHFANVLVDRQAPRVAAIVDWELATVGDPLLDLGWLLATWHDPDDPSSPLVKVEPWSGLPTRSELISRYAEGSPRDVSSIDWYEVLACYKYGIILEGTHARACAGMADKEVGDRLHGNSIALFRRALLRIAAS
jgi:aminoglycoside phosphotransferase (APT) family kinase protein